MKLPRDLSGRELVKLLCKRHAYQRVNQEGSHIILQTEVPQHHRIAIPDHDQLRLGTLNAILSAVARVKGISKDEILRWDS